jgi:SAM-dependent methyltransferase
MECGAFREILRSGVVEGLPAGRPTLRVGAPAASVARVGARRSAAPREGQRRIRSRTLDVGCGALGWLRVLSEWVGPSGRRYRGDLLNAARSFLETEGISNVELVVDDLFETKLEPESFDLVHARYVIAPLGRGREQVAAHRRLVKPGGVLVMEEWDLGSWHFNPTAPAAERLIGLLSEIFARPGWRSRSRTSRTPP